ncbi:MAG: type I restriction enzyme HsdR N-terminal domain-containing protein [Deltaproteobacteria bacterium]|nr:type I restriction enzyme HsdR N-terminal domain-containing protein [Deltaproteobacteria bacterium]
MTTITKEIIDRIFKEPGIKHELTEFESLGKPIHDILHIYSKTVEAGREAGETKFFLKSIVPFSSGKEEVQVHVDGGKSSPEEIVRQLWVYKLIHQYGYLSGEIDLEKSVQFGTEVGTKAADIIVYTDDTKETPKIIVECKKPKRKDGIEQLKSYMNAKGAPVAVWSNGSDSIILYRPYPKQFDDKLIFAKIWDGREAQENRRDKVVEFRKDLDPDITYDRINALFQKASGGVQQMITLERLRCILIPIFENSPQDKIGALHLNGLAERQKGISLYNQAMTLLESELGLDKLKFKKPMGYMARFRDLEQSRRLDPEHFYPEFQHLIANVPQHIELTPLGSQLSFCQRGKQPIYANEGLLVINSKHVRNNKINLDDNRAATPAAESELLIRYGDLLMNGTGRGTLGRAAPYFTENFAIPDNHVTILRSSTLDPAYLSFYLNSRPGQLQVEMHQRGTSGQLELYPFDIRKFLVWVAPESFQKEIRNLYDQAAESEQRSRALLDQAKTRVEQLIEEASET